jgi:glycosyltransferase involved in cell wall biosynthesis
MKRLIYVTDQPWSASDAPSVHVDRVCSGLSSLGWSVELVLPQSESVTTARAYRSTPVRVPRFWRAVTFQIAATPVLMLAFLRRPSAVLYIRQSTCLALPSVVAALFRVPIILEVNGNLRLETSQRHSKLDRFLHRIGVLQFIEAVNIRLAKEILVVAPGIRELIVNRYPAISSSIEVVPNGVDPAVKPAGRVKPADRFCVGYVGALESWQGLDYLIQAARLVKARVPGITFLLIGDGKEKASLRAQARDLDVDNSVEFVGAVPHHEVGSYLSQMDLCINYPVRARGGVASPMKIYEYIAACRAVLSADVAGLREEFGAAIAYVEAENPAELAAEIERLATDRAALASLQLRAESAAKSVRSWSDVAVEVSVICERASRSDTTAGLGVRHAAR